MPSLSVSSFLVFGLVFTVLAVETSAAGPTCSSACVRNKICCYDLDTADPSDARCFNPDRSDDHCGSCSIQCEKGHDAVFDRCQDSACTADFILLTRQRRDCQGGNYPDEPSGQIKTGGGQVTFSKPGGTSLAAHIIVTGGTPGVYWVRLIQVLPDNSDCDTSLATASTMVIDLFGNGDSTVSEALKPGSSSAFVYLNKQGNEALDQFGTALIRTIQ